MNYLLIIDLIKKRKSLVNFCHIMYLLYMITVYLISQVSTSKAETESLREQLEESDREVQDMKRARDALANDAQASVIQ